jgi:hypothetical protein
MLTKLKQKKSQKSLLYQTQSIMPVITRYIVEVEQVFILALFLAFIALEVTIIVYTSYAAFKRESKVFQFQCTGCRSDLVLTSVDVNLYAYKGACLGYLYSNNTYTNECYSWGNTTFWSSVSAVSGFPNIEDEVSFCTVMQASFLFLVWYARCSVFQFFLYYP